MAARERPLPFSSTFTPEESQPEPEPEERERETHTHTLSAVRVWTGGERWTAAEECSSMLPSSSTRSPSSSEESKPEPEQPEPHQIKSACLSPCPDSGLLTRGRRKLQGLPIPHTHGMDPWAWDNEEEAQTRDTHERIVKFYERKRSKVEADVFKEELYKSMKKNDLKHPGEVTEIRSGESKGWKVYKPTLQGIPQSLPKYFGKESFGEEFPKMKKIFKDNRVKWFNEGEFNIEFEGDVLKLTEYMHARCLDLVSFEVGGTGW